LQKAAICGDCHDWPGIAVFRLNQASLAAHADKFMQSAQA
jgi:hypothetical protein